MATLIFDPALGTVPLETAARWHCELVIGRWPDDFPIPKPHRWDEMDAYFRSSTLENLKLLEFFQRPYVEAAAREYWEGPFRHGQGPLEPEARPATWRDRPPML